MLTRAQIEEYNEVGAIVVPDVLTPDEVRTLSDVTDGFVERARGLTGHTEIYDLEDTHTPDNPRVRRIKAAHLHHPAYAALTGHANIMAVLQGLWGPDIRFDTAKLNMKCAGFGAPVEWHQDWAFYPHTNDNLAAVGVMFDDMAMENGPLMVIPGSHKGPIFDHHADGVFCGAMNPANRDVDFGNAVALTGKAGSITVHHVRAVHGSAPNVSDRDRRLLLFQFRSGGCLADPRLSRRDRGVRRTDGRRSVIASLGFRRPPCGCRLPPAVLQGSLYENQKGMKTRFFDMVPAQ